MRTFAIGDIHGCLAAFDSLLVAIAPTTDDTIITLGDYIDRGPDSRGVLERLMFLHSRGKIISLRGNHELMMIAARDGGRAEQRFWLQFGGSEALESYREPGKHVTVQDVPQKHFDFIEKTCKAWHETETHIFVHANLDPDLPMSEQPETTTQWAPLEAKTHRPHVNGKIMICGHTEQRTGVPLHLDRAICIDTWAYGDGWLTALHLETGECWQANELGQVRKGMLE
jgi:serine/threonine protein phosphatase 1